MDKPIQDSLALVKSVQKEIHTNLSTPEHIHNRLIVNSLFDRIIKRFEFIGGTVEPDENTVTTDPFPPLTSFMGEKITQPNRVTADQLNPKQAMLEKLKERVKKLYGEFLDITPETILKSYTNDDDIKVVRGVAKWAGVPDYESREVNKDFITAIAKGITDKKAAKDSQKKADTAAQKLKEKEDGK